MNEIELDYLYKFYDLLYKNFKSEKKILENSLILTLLKTRDSNRFNILRKSRRSSNLIPNEVLNQLIINEYVQNYEDIDTYVISVKGLWFIEKKDLKINEEKLLAFINNNYVISNKKEKLEDKEKVILFTMVSARVFSNISCVDLKKDFIIQEKWKNILEKSYDILFSLGYIKKEKNKIFGKTGNMHITTSIFRHNTYMKQRTKGIYDFNKKLEYYLNLYINESFLQDKLTFLFYKLFEGNISTDKIDKILEYCNNISKKESIYLFDMKNHIFSNPDYDIKIKDCLLESINLKMKWEKIS